ncbi:MAG: hypothetical protein KF764_15545 [Labilithrix sp.]|nr:hypothetical protein [Labilithrix sp.]
MANEESPASKAAEDAEGEPSADADEDATSASGARDDDAAGKADDDADEAPGDTAEKTDDAAPRAAAGAGERYRRLHTLSGALALGVFLVEHIATNASALGGHASYDSVVGAIERSRVLPFVEVVFILLPLAFHAGYGLYLLRSKAAPDAVIARYGDRRLWLLQRASAIGVLVFVLAHLWELRVQRLVFGLSADALHTTLTAHLSWTWAGVPFIALFYVLGLLAVSVHLSNGLFAATAAWNIGVSATGRRRARVATIALGGGLFLLGAATTVGLATGTRLLPEADGDSAAVVVPCGSAAPPPFRVAPTPSR